MILAISIFVVVFVLLQKDNEGKLFVKHEKGETIYFWNILFAPCAVYIIYFILYYFKII